MQTEINGWLLKELIGKGATSKVYRAVSADGNRECAVKIISIREVDYTGLVVNFDGADKAARMDLLRRLADSCMEKIQLEREFSASRAAVSVYECELREAEDEPGYDIYIRMELLTPLNKYIADSKMNEQGILKLGSDICSLLVELSERTPPVIHRDIKPANLFYAADGSFRLGDFGIAREIENTLSTMTCMGTLGYSAPEVASGRAYDCRADIYSLGMVMYVLANGNSLPDLSQSNAPSDLLPPPAGVSKAVGKVISRACAYRAEDRYKTPAEFLRELETASSGTRKAFGANKAVLFSAAAAVICLGGVALALSLGMRQPDALQTAYINSGSIPKTGADSFDIADNGGQSSAEAYEELSRRPESGETAPAADNMPESPDDGAETEAPDISEDIPRQSANYSTPPVTAGTTGSPPSGGTGTAASTGTVTTPVTSGSTRQSTTTSTAVRQTTPNTQASSPVELPDPLSDEETPASAFQWRSYKNGIELIKYEGSDENIVIPPQIDGKQVIRLGVGLFADNSIMRSVNIPEGVKEIGAQCFWFCTRLSRIELPQSLELIEGNGLYGCSALETLFIPRNVQEIGWLNFGYTGISSITVDSENSFYASADGVLFNKSMTTLIFYPRYKNDTSYTIPESTVEIASYAFDRTLFLKTLKLSKNVRTIAGDEIFTSVREFTADPDNQYFMCEDGVLFSRDGSELIAYPPASGRSEYTVPENVRVIGRYSFAQCDDLRKIILTAQPDYIDAAAAAFEIGLEVVTPSGQAYSWADYIGLYRSY